LDKTKDEIVHIRKSFERRFPKGTIKVLRGAEATDANLSNLAPKYCHLHVATHGFFAAPSVHSALAEDEPYGSADHFSAEEGVTGYHPGLLSGLVLAGANRPPAPGEDDGILTALEVAELDLRKADLVVLSACETGQGKVAGGEGILGLQRAFRVAGARTVVASLWAVEETATRDLMQRFYDNYLEKKMDRLEALREAQLWMVRHPPYARRAMPYYWAAFVLSGDWR
jgi:CHAT domain-containing protein